MVEWTIQCVRLISFNTCISAPAAQQEDKSQIRVATQDILGAAARGRVLVGGARQLVWDFDVATEGKLGRVEAVNTLHSSDWPEAKSSSRKLGRSCVALRWNISCKISCKQELLILILQRFHRRKLPRTIMCEWALFAKWLDSFFE